MSTDMRPTTDPAANGPATHVPDAADPRPDLPRWDEGPDKLPLTVSWREYVRDLRWSNRQHECGGFDQYAGEYVVVWEERVIAHGPDLLELRERVKRLPEIGPNDGVETYIEPSIFTTEGEP